MSVATAAVANPGDLDPTFGTAGRVFIDFPDYYEAATAIAQARDGKLLVGRWVYNFPAADDFSVLRLRTDGRPDTTFRGDGRTFVELGSPRGATRAVLELASSHIIAAGEVMEESGYSLGYGLVRYQASGAVDRSFGVNGVVRDALDGRVGSIEAIVEQPDGRLVAAGQFYVRAADPKADMAIMRFEPDGSLDPSFGAGGTVRVDFFEAGRSDIAHGLVRQADGKLVVAGLAFDASGARRLAVLRLMSDGTFDATFGNGGRLALDVQDVAYAGASLVARDDGRLVLSGQTRTQAGLCGSLIARLLPDGTLDATFDDDGIAELPFGPCYAAGVSNLGLEPNGSILISDTFAPQTFPSDIRISRLTSDGQLDRTFGKDGSGIVEMGSGGWSSRVDPSLGACMIRLSDGRIAFAASDQFDWEFGGSFFMVARLLATGGSAGIVGFTTDTISIDEGTHTSVIATVRRTGGAAGAASVDFATGSGSADAGDYTPLSGTLSWPDGDASERTITLRFADDALAEGPEHLALMLSNAAGASLATDQVTIVILDDEPPAPPPRANTPPPARTSDGGGGGFDWLLLVLLTGMLSPSAFARKPARARCSRWRTSLLPRPASPLRPTK